MCDAGRGCIKQFHLPSCNKRNCNFLFNKILRRDHFYSFLLYQSVTIPNFDEVFAIFYRNLLFFSRRWKREQEKVELSRGYSRPFIVGTLPPPPSTYHTKMPPAPTWAPPPTSNIYGTRWPEPQQNIYAVRAFFFLSISHIWVLFHKASWWAQIPLF